MARGKGSLLSPKPVALPQTYNAQRGGFAVNYPLSKKKQKKRIDHDPRLGTKMRSLGLLNFARLARPQPPRQAREVRRPRDRIFVPMKFRYKSFSMRACRQP